MSNIQQRPTENTTQKKSGDMTKTALAVACFGVHFRLEVSYVSFLDPKIWAELQIWGAEEKNRTVSESALAVLPNLQLMKFSWTATQIHVWL